MPQGNRARGNPIVRHTVRKRNEAQHSRDLDRVAHLYLRGYSHQQIAEIISAEQPYTISRQMITKDISTIRELWVKSASLAYEEAIGRELAKIDELERAAWDSFEKSIGDKKMELKEVVKTTGAGEPDGQRIRAISKTATDRGTTKYLEIVQWCIEKRVELLGIKTASASLTINWQEQARKDGFSDPTALFEQVVSGFIEKMDTRDDKLSDAGSQEANVIDARFEDIPGLPG